MKVALPKIVIIGESIVREGVQHEEHFIPTEAKIWLINHLAQAGFKRIEVTNFAPSKFVPHFRDAELVLQGIERIEGVDYQALTLSNSAVKRAVECCKNGYGPTTAVAGLATSEAYSKKNFGGDSEKILGRVGEWAKILIDNGMKFCGNISTVFGCALEGRVPLEKGYILADKMAEMGATSIIYGDTHGDGTPDRSYEFFSEIKKRLPEIHHIAHFHDTRGWGIANCFAALEAGIEFFDASMGGIGGQVSTMLDRIPIPGVGKRATPSDIMGNVSTEDLIVLLDEMGIDTGIDIEMALEIGRTVEKIFGRRLNSKCVETGRIVNK